VQTTTIYLVELIPVTIETVIVTSGLEFEITGRFSRVFQIGAILKRIDVIILGRGITIVRITADILLR